MLWRYWRFAVFAGVILLQTGAARAEDEPAWTSFVDDDTAALTFAVPDSDDSRFALVCHNAERRVELTVYEEIEGAKLRQPVTIELSAGGLKASIAGQTATDELNGFIYAEANKVKIEALLPVLQAAGELKITVAKAAVTLPELGRAAAVASFAQGCKVK